MTNEGSLPPVDVLLSNAAWVRRLAHSLLRDPAAAEEIAQDALLAGWQHPPTTDRPVRAWFGQVVRNLVLNRAASERARARREQESAQAAPGVPSPEEMTARMELQRLLVRLVDELDEPYRHTVLLRYFEERSAEEIARAQGIPAGTVRWRLKVGLDRLRDRLREGDRDRWRARLALVALPAPARPPAAAPWLLALAVTGTLVVVVVARATAPRGRPPALEPAPAQVASPVPTSVVPSGDLAGCRSTVARLERELWLVEAELRRYGDPEKLFGEAPADPTAQAAIAPLVTEVMAGGEASHVLECHTGVCRLVVVARSEEEYEASVHLDRPAGRALGQRSWRVELPRKYTRAVDPVSGEVLRRYSVTFALEDPEGRLIAGELPDAPPLAPPAAAACPARLASLEERLRVARPERDRVLPAIEQFARQPSDPRLTGLAQEEVRRSAGPAFAGRIECHGPVCRTTDFELAGHLGRDPIFLARVAGPWRDATGVYFRWLTAPRKRNEADDFLRSRLWEEPTGRRYGLGLDGFLPLERCRSISPSDGRTGRLTIHLVVPATGELNADGEADRISVHLDGDGLASPFGQCLAAELHRRIDGVAVPRPMPERAEKELRLGITLPGKPR